MRRRMVAGFLFRVTSVLLVEKTHPEWQRGLMNGVGGHVEEGETAMDAMRREFREETGLYVPTWDPFAMEVTETYEVEFFRARLPDDDQWRKPATNDAGEALHWFRHDGLGVGSAVGNLHWLIPLARDWRKLSAAVVVSSDIRERPTW